MTMPFDKDTLVKKYTPVLVLYPEIPEGSTRVRNPDYPHVAPLDHDYHPRDIRMVLEHSSLHRRLRPWNGKACDWQKMLDRMEKTDYKKDIDVLPGVGVDDREAFWKTYAGIPKGKAHYERACYARVVMGSGVSYDRIVVQYWYAYFYNDFFNTHEMDWEPVMIVFKLTDDGPRPTTCAYAGHFGGHWLPWPEVEKANEELKQSKDGTHPVVYVANGSHANHYYGGALYMTAPPLVGLVVKLLNTKRRLVDYTISWEDGDHHLVEAKLIPPAEKGRWTGDWRWLNQKGRWGSPGKWDLKFGDAGIPGPSQGGDWWDHPFRWIDTSCTRAPSHDESRLPTRIEPQEPKHIGQV